MEHIDMAQVRTVLMATDYKNSVLLEGVENTTNRRSYSVYGHQQDQEQVLSCLGFNGQPREIKNGWYLLGNGYRAYNPRLMRFHSPDSWSPFGEGGLHAYMYGLGDPMNSSDPTGHVSLFPGLPLQVRKVFSGLLKFFSSSSDITGPSRTKALRATEPFGGMSPQKDGFLRAMGRIGTVVAGAPGPTGTSSPPIQYTELRPRHHPGYEAAGDGSRVRRSRAVTQSASRGGGGVMRSRSSSLTSSPSPPSYNEAMSMPFWSADTFATSQPPRTFTVNRMAVDRADNFAAAAPYQAHADAAPPALVAQQHQLLNGLAQLNNLQRDVMQIRADNRRWRAWCHIL